MVDHAHDAEDDASLFARHLRGEDEAFSQLFRRFQHRLFMYCLRLTGSSEGAEDAMQELWERVIRLRANAQRVDNPAGFLVTVARNICLNQIKARKRIQFFSHMEDAAFPAAADREHTEEEEAVLKALHALPLRYREVLVLHEYWGYSFGEIATLLDSTPEAMWKRASRAREKLRNSIGTFLPRGYRHT